MIVQNKEKIGQLAFSYELTKLKKYISLNLIKISVHLVVLLMIMFTINTILLSLFLKDEMFFDYLCASTKFLSSTAMIESDGKVYLAREFVSHYSFIMIVFLAKFIFVSLCFYIPAGIYINNKTQKYFQKIAEKYESKVIGGSIILENDEFINKYNELGMNKRGSGVFVSQIFKLEEVTDDNTDKKFL